MSRPLRILLDDERNPGADVHVEDWIVVRDVPSLLDLLRRRDADVAEISFDNDLQQPLEGRDALAAITEMLLDGELRLPSLGTITVHSANGDAARPMCGTAANMRRHGLLGADVEIVYAPCTDRPLPLAADDSRRFTIHRTP